MHQSVQRPGSQATLLRAVAHHLRAIAHHLRVIAHHRIRPVQGKSRRRNPLQAAISLQGPRKWILGVFGRDAHARDMMVRHDRGVSPAM